jgi:hypothetical protein
MEYFSAVKNIMKLCHLQEKNGDHDVKWNKPDFER